MGNGGSFEIVCGSDVLPIWCVDFKTLNIVSHGTMSDYACRI